MRHRPSNRIHQLENDPSSAPRRYPLWVDERDTPADIEAKRERDRGRVGERGRSIRISPLETQGRKLMTATQVAA
jgi:hypothetical protein